MEDFWDKPVLRQLLLAGSVWYLIGATFWSMPSGFPMKATIDNFYDKELRWLGLWQGWGMFAPVPRDEDIYITANVEFADGTTITESLSNMAEMPYGQRYARERWRKFMNDNMRLDSNNAMWNDSAAWVARRSAGRAGKEVHQVDLYRHWRKSLIAGEAGNVLEDNRPFNKFLFHSFKPSAVNTAPGSTPLVPLSTPEGQK